MSELIPQKQEIKYVWYVAYGSNLSQNRFNCYIEGGQPEGAAKTYPGCKDKTLPSKVLITALDLDLYFAMSSRNWQNGGIAFINSQRSETAKTKSLMYLITKEQFSELMQQEVGSREPIEVDFDELETKEQLIVKENVKYGKVIWLGKHEGHPVVTFTHEIDLINFTKPSIEYLSTIVKGLADFSCTKDEVFVYLSTKNGILGNYNESELKRIIENCSSAFKEYSKEYRLNIKDLDQSKLKNNITELQGKLPLYSFLKYDVIPDELIEDYVNLCREGERHTPALLSPGEEPKTTEATIRDSYAWRSAATKYFDVIAIDEAGKIVGKINGWGFKEDTFHIFHLFVLPSEQGKKIGKMLVLKMLEYALLNDSSIPAFELQTMSSNEPAQKIIADLNFKLKLQGKNGN